MRAALFCAVLALAMSHGAAAQGLGGYVTAGTGSIDYLVSRETILQATGGVLWTGPGDRIRVGVEGDLLTSNGYISGKGGPVGEFAILRGRVQPFARGGYFWGEDSAWVAGGGVDVWFRGRVGLRVLVQDAIRQSQFSSYEMPGLPRESRTFHEPAVQVGVVWRPR